VLGGWAEARRRVLSERAVRARESAARLRAEAGQSPAEAETLRVQAADLEQLAQACVRAAADLSLPTPERIPAEEV